jgi:glycosyltransferase involved in cell wall biosynthesis
MLGIVTPTLNSEKYIESTFESIKSMLSNGKCKYLIVDGGSTDGTLKFCSENCIEYYYLPKGNMYTAINFGLRKLEVKWVTYINSDDMLNAEAVLDAIDKYGENADIIYGNTSYIDNKGNLIYRYKGAHISLFEGLFLNGQLPFSQPGTIISASVFSNLGGFSEEYRYASDLDFFIAAYLSGIKFKKYEFDDLGSFRIHNSQITKTQKIAMSLEIKEIIRKYQKSLNKKYLGLDMYLNKLINFRSFFSRIIYLIKSFLRDKKIWLPK